MDLLRKIRNIQDWIFHDERPEIIERIDRVENHYKESKSELENIQSRINPLKTLLLEMEKTFNSKDQDQF